MAGAGNSKSKGAEGRTCYKPHDPSGLFSGLGEYCNLIARSPHAEKPQVRNTLEGPDPEAPFG